MLVLEDDVPLCLIQGDPEVVDECSELVLLGSMVSSLNFEGFLKALWTFLGFQQETLELLQTRKTNMSAETKISVYCFVRVSNTSVHFYQQLSCLLLT